MKREGICPICGAVPRLEYGWRIAHNAEVSMGNQGKAGDLTTHATDKTRVRCFPIGQVGRAPSLQFLRRTVPERTACQGKKQMGCHSSAGVEGGGTKRSAGQEDINHVRWPLTNAPLERANVWAPTMTEETQQPREI